MSGQPLNLIPNGLQFASIDPQLIEISRPIVVSGAIASEKVTNLHMGQVASQIL